MLARTRKLLRRLKRSQYATNIRMVATSAVFSQLLLIACTPILTRLYTPVDFGILAIFVSFLGVMPVVANFRYDIAITLSRDRQESFHILAVCILSTILVTGAVGIVIASGVLSNSSTELSEIQPYGWLVVLGTFCVGTYTALNAWVGYTQNFSLVAKVRIKQALASVVAQVGLGFLTAGPIGLLVGYVASQSYGATSFAAELRRSGPLGRIRLRDIAQAANRHRQFFFYAFPAGVVNRLGIQVIPLLFGHFFSLATAGFYLLAQRLVALPTLVIGRSVSQVYTNKLAKDSIARTSHLLPTYLKTALALFALGIAPMGLLAAGAPWLFSAIFGAEWRQAGVICQILTPAFYAQFVVSPMIQTLNVLGHQKAQLIWDIVRLVSIVAVFPVSEYYTTSPTAAVMAISATLTATYVLQFLLSIWAIRRFDKDTEIHSS